MDIEEAQVLLKPTTVGEENGITIEQKIPAVIPQRSLLASQTCRETAHFWCNGNGSETPFKTDLIFIMTAIGFVLLLTFIILYYVDAEYSSEVRTIYLYFFLVGFFLMSVGLYMSRKTIFKICRKVISTIRSHFRKHPKFPWLSPAQELCCVALLTVGIIILVPFVVLFHNTVAEVFLLFFCIIFAALVTNRVGQGNTQPNDAFN